jgi:hypothetical protein
MIVVIRRWDECIWYFFFCQQQQPVKSKFSLLGQNNAQHDDS